MNLDWREYKFNVPDKDRTDTILTYQHGFRQALAIILEEATRVCDSEDGDALEFFAIDLEAELTGFLGGLMIKLEDMTHEQLEFYYEGFKDCENRILKEMIRARLNGYGLGQLIIGLEYINSGGRDTAELNRVVGNPNGL